MFCTKEERKLLSWKVVSQQIYVDNIQLFHMTKKVKWFTSETQPFSKTFTKQVQQLTHIV